ncbi:hypothetical protein D3C72_1932540 [compost metagenome]
MLRTIGSSEASHSARMAGRSPMPSAASASASTASDGTVLPTLKICISRSAQRRMHGRLSAMPAGMPVTSASAIDIATSRRWSATS